MRGPGSFARALVLVAGAGSGSALLALPPPGAAGGFEEVVLPYLERHCYACHSGRDPKALLDLARYDRAETALADAQQWRDVAERVAAGEMPPSGRARPGVEEQRAFLAWIEESFDPESAIEAAEPEPHPGRPPLRRLNNREYRNTVRDLFGVDLEVESYLPADPVGRGFDNQGDALDFSELRTERYLEAAERVARRAIRGDGRPSPPVHRYEASALDGPRRGDLIALAKVGAALAEHRFPRDGEYEIRVRSFGQQAGPEPCRMGLLLDGEEVEEFVVEATQDAPQDDGARVQARAGMRRIHARFLNDYYRPDAEDPTQRDRNLFVAWIEVRGPLDRPPPTPFQTRLFERFDEGLGAQRERAILRHLARRAWRRPPSRPELARLERLSDGADSLEEGVRLALVGILASPHFLFRVEQDPPDAPAVRALNGWELATRLSYFLWSTTPDEPLLALAADGALTNPEVLDDQAQRMLHHPRARALAEGFAEQWLQIRNLDRISPDPGRFPEFDEELRRSMRRETLDFFEAVLRERRSVWDLLEADFSFVNGPLATLYGIPGVEGRGFRRVSLADTPRRGLLGQASVLTVTSNPTRTSPVKRGKWVLEVLLGAPPPPPPPGLDSLDESPAAVAAASLRERLEIHRRDARCAACHAGMDPLGFGLENFDALGRWREEAEGFAVDASGELPDGRRFTGPVELTGILREDDAFLRSLVVNLLVYALGRDLERADRAELRRLLAALDPDAPSLEEILRAIIQSDAFRMRRTTSS